MKLIVHGKWAPAEAVAKILATWSKLACEIEKKATLLKGCELEWQLMLQHVGYRGHVLLGIVGGAEPVDCWEAYGQVSMVSTVCVNDLSKTEIQDIMIPLTRVSEIMINDDGTFFWHSEMKTPEESPQVVYQIAQAVSTGKLNDRHYQCNRIPTL